jgi:MFS family permease
VPGFPALLTGTLLARTAINMLQITLVLFVLREYRSATLAGLASFLWIFPSLVVSPVAGALLDRHGRVRLIVLDYSVQVVAFVLVAALSLAGRLPAAALLAIIGLASITGLLSVTGGRTLFPMLVPERLWERANAIDSQGYVVGTLVGPPAAGFLVGAFGGAKALIACAGVVLLSVAAMRMVPEPAKAPAPGSIWANAAAGVRYVFRSASLRGLAITVTTYNVAYGIFTIALPVLVLDRLHEPPLAVGVAYAVSGLVGVVAGLLVGRMRTRDRERQMMVAANALTLLALLLLPEAGSIAVVLLASAVLGLAAGPFDIAMFTLRQRRTAPAWYGRAFAVSMSLNYAGMPIGSAIAGPLIGWSLGGALWAAVALTAVTTILPMIAIPAQEPRQVAV